MLGLIHNYLLMSGDGPDRALPIRVHQPAQRQHLSRARARLQEEELHPLLQVQLCCESDEADQDSVRPPGDHEPLQSASRSVIR